MKVKVFLLICLLAVCLPAANASAERKIPILIYHSIAEFKGHGSQELYVSPDAFEQQMLYLREHGFTPLTFEQWQEMDQVAKPIFLTFDDGYKNNLTAFAVFKKLKTDTFSPKGTFFVISEFIGRSNRLSEDDLKMLATSGMVSIQSHSATHPDLRKVDNLEYELKGSKEAIARITGKPVIALAYPYGIFNKKVIAETKKYYDFGIATTPEYFVKRGAKDEQYTLPRLYITYTTTIAEFAKIVEGK
ncbi:polysaccharide deacetylase family protein [Bacillus sp. 1P06AnD]|uniref:polysaccharide deacetylase family protein n=1 Tax=Bacillus sp. 1P06AnD TaxID=3132208 RepID=UPI0039A1B54E